MMMMSAKMNTALRLNRWHRDKRFQMNSVLQKRFRYQNLLKCFTVAGWNASPKTAIPQKFVLLTLRLHN